MSNLPPNPFNAAGLPPMNANTGPPLNHNQQFNQVPPSQLPPGYGGLKQDANSNSPIPQSSTPQNVIGQDNNFSQSASSSPAFNQPGMMPPSYSGLQSSPVRPPNKPMAPSPNQNPLPPPMNPLPADRQRVMPNTSSPTPYLQQRQINDNAPPLVSSSHNQPLTNGPPMPGLIQPPNPYPAASSAFPPMVNRPPISASGPMNPQFGQAPLQGQTITRPPGLMSPPNVPFSGPPVSGPPRNSPLIPGPVNGPPTTGPPITSGPPIGPVISGPPMGLPRNIGVNGPANPNGPPMPPVSGLGMGPPNSLGSALQSGPAGLSGPPVGGLPLGQYLGPKNGVHAPPRPPGLMGPPTGPQSLPSGLQSFPSGPQSLASGPQGLASGPLSPPMSHLPPMGPAAPTGQQMGPPPNTPLGPTSGPVNPPKNMQGRYPQMPPSNYVNHQPPMPPQPNLGKPYPQQYNTQGLAQQMGQLSVTKQGFDQLWGHQMVDLLTCKTILPEYPEDPPEIRLGHQFVDSPNCSPE